MPLRAYRAQWISSVRVRATCNNTISTLAWINKDKLRCLSWISCDPFFFFFALLDFSKFNLFSNGGLDTLLHLHNMFSLCRDIRETS